MILSEGQYELDGVLFGDAKGNGSLIILESGDSTTGSSIRSQDVEAPRGDFLNFGRDYLTPPERSFVIGVNTTDPSVLRSLRGLWRADNIRKTPGAVSTLRWCLNGITYRAYGRTRAFEVLGPASYDPEWVVVNASFQYRDSYAFLDNERSVTLTAFAPVTGSGLILPAVLPWVLGSSPTERAGVVDAEGDVGSPFKLTIEGPVTGSSSQIKVWSNGWLLDFGSLTLLPNDVLQVDTLAMTVTLNGFPVPGLLSMDSTLQGRIQPGPQEFRFSCADDSATTKTTISWFDTSPIF